MPVNAKTQSRSRKAAPREKQARGGGKATEEDRSRTSNMREEVAAYRKDLILQAARNAFFEHGYHECTVDMIAERLSGSKAIVYYYFADKHSILEEIYRRALEEAQSLIRKAISENEDPSAKLVAFARYYAEWVISNQRVVAIFWREVQSLSAEARAAVALEQKRMDDLVAVIIRDGAAQGQFDVKDVQTTARAITGMISFTYTWWRDDRRLSRDDAAQYYAETALRHVGFRSP